MSLTSLIKQPDVAARLQQINRPLSLLLAAPIRAAPQTDHYSLVGTAFDYLLRFEFQRQAPHACTSPWIAEQSTDQIRLQVEMSELYRTDRASSATRTEIKKLKNALKTATLAVRNTRMVVSDFLASKRPNRELKTKVAAGAIRLAKLDGYYRAGVLPEVLNLVDDADVFDLLSLLDITPIKSITGGKPLLLNPNFGRSGAIVGGADADAICGDLLIDFKVTKKSVIDPQHLNQLLGYFFLARHHRHDNAKFPIINRIAIYFARHGHLWVQDTKVWTSQPEFHDCEKWFLSRTKLLQTTRGDLGDKNARNAIPSQK